MDNQPERRGNLLIQPTLSRSWSCELMMEDLWMPYRGGLHATGLAEPVSIQNS